MYSLHQNSVRLSAVPKEETAFGFSKKQAITADLLYELNYFFHVLNAIKIIAVFISM